MIIGSLGTGLVGTILGNTIIGLGSGILSFFGFRWVSKKV